MRRTAMDDEEVYTLPAEVEVIADEVAKQVDQLIFDTVEARDFAVVDKEGLSYCFRSSHLAALVLKRLKEKYGIS